MNVLKSRPVRSEQTYQLDIRSCRMLTNVDKRGISKYLCGSNWGLVNSDNLKIGVLILNDELSFK